MKRLLLFLLLGLGLLSQVAPSVAHADSLGLYSQTSASGAFFRTDLGDTPVTYTPKTIVGPGILLKKLVLHPNSLTGTPVTTMELWDSGPNETNGANNGKTGTAKARKLFTLHLFTPSPTEPGNNTYDFTTIGGDRNDNGIIFQGYPMVVTSGTNTPNASAVYSPWIGNRTQP